MASSIVEEIEVDLVTGMASRIAASVDEIGGKGLTSKRMARRQVSEAEIAAVLSAPEITVEVPSAYTLERSFPNPFNPATTIRFSLPESAQVRLVVFDVLGRKVRLLLDGTREAGTHEVVFDASALPSGMYLYRLETPQGSFVRTMLLMK